MSDDRKNIKISEETHRLLTDEKPSGVTWDYFLKSLVDDSIDVHRHPDDFDGPVTVEVDGNTVTLGPGQRRTVGDDGPTCPECASPNVEHSYGDAPGEEMLECQNCGHSEHFAGAKR